MRRSTRIDGSAGGEPLSCGTQSTYNRVANAGNLHRLSPFQMPLGILHNLTGKSSLTFSIEKCHFITVIYYLTGGNNSMSRFFKFGKLHVTKGNGDKLLDILLTASKKLKRSLAPTGNLYR